MHSETSLFYLFGQIFVESVFMSLLFSKFSLGSPKGELQLSNRIVVAPMCQYSADDGAATDWHLMHWGSLLNSGAGLFIIEATGVTPAGRITPVCLGLWDERTEAALQDKLTRARALAPAVPVFIQLAHAGDRNSLFARRTTSQRQACAKWF